ncbi:MAG: alpha/beta hydrolase [Pseudomonadota bacterium]
MARWDRGDQGTSIPDWFWEAVETEPETRTVEVDECDVMYRRYGDTAKPGLLLVHGMYAHARWYDFIAPRLTDDFCVAAMDLTGMGDSDYRYEYKGEVFAEEIRAVADDAGFGDDVIVAAHSFGGAMAAKSATRHADRYGKLILIDSGMRHPDEPEPERPSMMHGRAKIYPDRAAAEARFRLQPPQECKQAFVLQYVAKQSLMPADGGWAWKFDDDMPGTMVNCDRLPEDYQGLHLPVGIIYGAESDSFTRMSLEYMRELISGEVPAVEIADAQHHVFLDQPLAFIDALREVINRLG